MDDNTNGMPDLDKIERAVWMRYYQDGLMDIFMGIMLMLMGAGSVLMERFGWEESSAIIAMAILVSLATVGLIVAKRLLTYPRIGQVKFGPKGKSRHKKWAVVLSGSAAMGLIAFLLALAAKGGGLQGMNPDLLIPVIYVVNMVVVFGMLGWIADLPRFYLMGVLFAIPIPLVILAKELAGIRVGYYAFAVPGGIIVLMGVLILIRFLRQYPRLQGGY